MYHQSIYFTNYSWFKARFSTGEKKKITMALVQKVPGAIVAVAILVIVV
jgi:hypothetical protein